MLQQSDTHKNTPCKITSKNTPYKMSSFSWCADVKSFQKLQIWLALIFQCQNFQSIPDES